MNGMVNFVRGVVRAVSQMVYPRFPYVRWNISGLHDERNYAGLVGDGRGSALLMSCVSWVVNAFIQMRPMVVDVADEDELSATQVAGHPVSRLFRRPTFDPRMGRSYYTWMTMIGGLLVSFIVDGNAYLMKIRGAGGAGRPVQLWYIPHWQMTPVWDPEDPTTFISYYDYCPDGATHYRVDVDDVVHLRDGIDPDNIRKGLSKVKTLLREIYTDEEAARWTASLLRNHALPGLIIAPKMPLENHDDAKAVKDRLNVEFGGDRRGSGLVLEGPADVTTVGWTPEQMKLGDIRDIPEERISSAVGIPAAVIGFGAGLQSTKVGATMAELVDLAWQNGVMPRALAIAAEITEQLLTDFESDAGEGTEFVFDTSKVPIMADYRLKEAQTLEYLMRWSVIRRGEARKRLGLPVGVRDNVYTLSSGLTEVDADKSLEIAPAVKPIAETAPVTAPSPGGAPPAIEAPKTLPALPPGPAKASSPGAQKRGALVEVLADRDGWDCSLCGTAMSEDEQWPSIFAVTIDHIIPKSQGGSDEQKNLRLAHFGCNSNRGAARREQTAPPKFQLTPRQTDIARLLAGGLQNKQIAHRMGLSERTVERGLSDITSKLAVDSRESLVLWAREQFAARS